MNPVGLCPPGSTAATQPEVRLSSEVHSNVQPKLDGGCPKAGLGTRCRAKNLGDDQGRLFRALAEHLSDTLRADYVQIGELSGPSADA